MLDESDVMDKRLKKTQYLYKTKDQCHVKRQSPDINQHMAQSPTPMDNGIIIIILPGVMGYALRSKKDDNDDDKY